MAGPKRQPRDGGPRRTTTASTNNHEPQKTTLGGIKRLAFDSVSAFGDYMTDIDNRDVFGSGRTNTAARNTPQKEAWCMHTSLDTALEMTRNGGYWSQGAEALQAVEVSTAIMDEYTITPALDLSLVGGCVDVGEYLAGNPECMLGINEDEPNTPVVTVGICVGAPVGTDSSIMFNYGRAALALVDALERQAYSVELIATKSNMSRVRGELIGLELDLTLKRAGEAWNASSVAFVTAHPAFARRVCFRAVEAFSESCQLTFKKYGYGNGSYMQRSERDIMLPWISTETRQHLTTPADALAFVMECAKIQRPELFA